MIQIKVDKLKVAYSGHTVLDGVSVNINSGEYTCVIGENGSGKSTLVKAILGLVPISDGKVELAIDKAEISYLPQITLANRSFPATVSEIVLCGTQKSGKRIPIYTKADRLAAKKAMESVDILGLADRRIGELSGGQQQRVMLARTLCREPKLLILDEPCSGLDPVMTAELYEILHSLNKKYAVSVLMVSHDVNEVNKFADRVIVINNRNIEYDGPTNTWREILKKNNGTEGFDQCQK